MDKYGNVVFFEVTFNDGGVFHFKSTDFAWVRLVEESEFRDLMLGSYLELRLCEKYVDDGETCTYITGRVLVSDEMFDTYAQGYAQRLGDGARTPDINSVRYESWKANRRFVNTADSIKFDLIADTIKALILKSGLDPTALIYVLPTYYKGHVLDLEDATFTVRGFKQ